MTFKSSHQNCWFKPITFYRQENRTRRMKKPLHMMFHLILEHSLDPFRSFFTHFSSLLLPLCAGFLITNYKERNEKGSGVWNLKNLFHLHEVLKTCEREKRV